MVRRSGGHGPAPPRSAGRDRSRRERGPRRGAVGGDGHARDFARPMRPLERGVAIGVIDSDQVRVRVGVGGPLSEGARAAGRNAAFDALEDMPLPPPDRVAR